MRIQHLMFIFHWNVFVRIPKIKVKNSRRRDLHWKGESVVVQLAASVISSFISCSTLDIVNLSPSRYTLLRDIALLYTNWRQNYSRI